MTTNDLQWQLDSLITKLGEELVNVHNRIHEHELPALIRLMTTLHGWAGASVEPWHAELLKQADEQSLLTAVSHLRMTLKLCDDVAANAEATLRKIHDQQPAKPVTEASKA